MDTEMKTQLDLLIPKSLDEIICTNRDKAELWPASDQEKCAVCIYTTWPDNIDQGHG